MKRAQELDPISTYSLGGLAHVYLLMRRYDESIPHFHKALDLYPNAAFIRAQLAWSYAMKRMYPEALTEYDKIAEADKAVAPENQLVADGLGWVYAVAGRRADALKIAKEVEQLSSRSYVDFYQLATIYAGLGAKDETFRLLEKGYQQRSAGMLYLLIDPFWDNVRSDPRYTDLLRRVGLSQPQ
jgi:tetratricopeptide (TPR) repeat protein